MTQTKKETSTTKKRRTVKATVETTIVVCQCGCATFNVESRTKTAVSLACSKCGNKTSVKGPVALANVPEGEVAAAVKSPVRPDPDYEPKKPGKKKGGDEDEDKSEYTMLRFRVGIEAKGKVIDKAMEAVRVMNCADPNFKAQTWQGHSLEYLCADFLGGCDPAVLEVVDDIEKAAEEAANEAETAGKKPAAISRKVRETRQRVMEQGAAQLGIIEPGGKKQGPPPKEDQPLKDDDGDERVKDDGRLVKAVKKALIEYAEEYRADTGNTIGLLLDVSLQEASKRAKKDGGFVVMVVGDERTRNVGGATPSMYFWMSMEPGDRALELEIEYSDQFENDLPTVELEVLEMLPANWNKLAKAKRWPMPSFCGGREIMKGKTK